MTHSCGELIRRLNKSIDKVNFEVASNMTDPNMTYQLACIKPNVTYDFYFKSLKREWEEHINDFINNPEKCSSLVSNLMSLYEISGSAQMPTIQPGKFNPEDIVLDVVASIVMRTGSSGKFELKENAAETFYNFIKILGDHCYCQMIDMFKLFVEKYSQKYQTKIQGKSKEEVKQILRGDFDYFKTFVKNINLGDVKVKNTNLIEDMASRMTGLYSLSVENELDKLIPNELGSLKAFFVKIISTYYNNIHPIIWAQIFKNMTEKLFEELPFTPSELFSFASKHLLLNSGPFILKILQMIRPVLSPELATKYNLTKLTYPQLQSNQIQMILGKVVKNWDLYEVMYNKSASVGHVCIVKRIDDPTNVFVIKIIKPLAIAQSCWEYKTLHRIFAEGSCEQHFVKNMLESNGRELNVKNEINNLNVGYENYTADYKDIFSADIDVKLTSVKPIENVIHDSCWFALAMTLAPGMPVADLVESDQLKNDTRFRAKLHRCMDLLVQKFFFTIVQKGFYHGDLHAGNIFFSYKESQMTLIDFGAVGEINLFDKDPSVQSLLEIMVMSMFYNFDDILDKMTVLLNGKCPETKIDTSSPEYAKLKADLRNYKLQNIKNHNREQERAKQFETDIFSTKRINDEIAANKIGGGDKAEEQKSIYSYFEIPPKEKETVVENKDVLPVFTEIVGDTESITFPKVLEMIIKFYAKSGVNIAIKFNDFYEFQKAYALLLGVLHKVGYTSYRSSIAMRKAIANWRHIKKGYEVSSLYNILKIYSRENNLFKGNGGVERPEDRIEYPQDLKVEVDIVDINPVQTTQNQKYYTTGKKIVYRLKKTNT